jgi:Uma2 family endonuclease
MANSSISVKRKTRDKHQASRPTWEIARLFPAQGDWTEEEFLKLEGLCGDPIRVELNHGCLEVLPVPTLTHQLIVAYFYEFLKAFTVADMAGLVLFSGMRVRISTKGNKSQFRQPDVLYMKKENLHHCLEDYWEGADLVMEVVSGDPKDRERDLVEKPREYALAGIPEYWIVDPEEKFIRVLNLRGKAYKVREFGPGMQATSKLLPGFAVSVDAVLASGRRKGTSTYGGEARKKVAHEEKK